MSPGPLIMVKAYSAEDVASFFRPGFTSFRFVEDYLRIIYFVMNQCTEHTEHR